MCISHRLLFEELYTVFENYTTHKFRHICKFSGQSCVSSTTAHQYFAARKRPLCFSVSFCAQFRTERLNINGATRQITIYLMPRAPLQPNFGLFFLFLSLKSCLFTHCCGTIQCSLYLPWRFGSYAISLIGVCFAQSRAIIFIERKNHHEKKMRQTHC